MSEDFILNQSIATNKGKENGYTTMCLKFNQNMKGFDLILSFQRTLRPYPLVPEIEVEDGLGPAMNDWGTFNIMNEVSKEIIIGLSLILFPVEKCVLHSFPRTL